jgi:hypothetical protein
MLEMLFGDPPRMFGDVLEQGVLDTLVAHTLSLAIPDDCVSVPIWTRDFALLPRVFTIAVGVLDGAVDVADQWNRYGICWLFCKKSDVFHMFYTDLLLMFVRIFISLVIVFGLALLLHPYNMISNHLCLVLCIVCFCTMEIRC